MSKCHIVGNHVTAQVVLNGQASESPCFIRCTPGVGYLADLFLIFINDLLDNIKSSVRLFADNFVVGRFIICKTVLFYRKILTVLRFGRLHDWQTKLMLPKSALFAQTNTSITHYTSKKASEYGQEIPYTADQSTAP